MESSHQLDLIYVPLLDTSFSYDYLLCIGGLLFFHNYFCSLNFPFSLIAPSIAHFFHRNSSYELLTIFLKYSFYEFLNTFPNFEDPFEVFLFKSFTFNNTKTDLKANAFFTQIYCILFLSFTQFHRLHFAIFQSSEKLVNDTEPILCVFRFRRRSCDNFSRTFLDLAPHKIASGPKSKGPLRDSPLQRRAISQKSARHNIDKSIR